MITVWRSKWTGTHWNTWFHWFEGHAHDKFYCCLLLSVRTYWSVLIRSLWKICSNVLWTEINTDTLMTIYHSHTPGMVKLSSQYVVRVHRCGKIWLMNIDVVTESIRFNRIPVHDNHCEHWNEQFILLVWFLLLFYSLF